MRLIPIAAADLQSIYRSDDSKQIPKTALDRFSKTHLYTILDGKWNPETYQRAEKAREWYSTATGDPTGIGRAIARSLTALGLKSYHEKSIKSPNGNLRADVLVERSIGPRTQVILELKAFAPENTRPSSISEAIKSTLRKDAIYAGFIKR